MNLAIDLGGSSAKALSLNPFEVQLKQSEDGQRDLDYLISLFPDARKVAVTGGKSRLLDGKFTRIDEITAIGKGGLYLSKLESAVVVSIGTGTAVVNAGKKIKHLGGTAVGGGTLVGLGKIILGISDPVKLEELASKGDANKVDLTVGDICGGPVGIIPADATASNFAKVTKTSEPADIAAALHRMVAQTIGLVSHFASQGNNIVFIGQPTKNDLLKKEITETLKLFNRTAVFPDKSEYGTAIGAYVSAFGASVQ
jgi:type II pantothenate kinase